MGVAPGMVYSIVLQKMYTKKHYGDVEATDRVPSVPAEYLTRHSTVNNPNKMYVFDTVNTPINHTPSGGSQFYGLLGCMGLE